MLQARQSTATARGRSRPWRNLAAHRVKVVLTAFACLAVCRGVVDPWTMTPVGWLFGSGLPARCRSRARVSCSVLPEECIPALRALQFGPRSQLQNSKSKVEATRLGEANSPSSSRFRRMLGTIVDLWRSSLETPPQERWKKVASTVFQGGRRLIFNAA